MNEPLNPTEKELTDEVVSKFYEAFNQSFNESPFGDFIFKALRNGQKEIYNKSIRETKIFDDNFLSVMQSAFQCVSRICRDPKKALKYEQEVVAIEKAKKIDTDSIRHLASHTHLIKNVSADGSVTPSKILTTYSEDRLDIYENVFIKTLINRLVRFLEDRLKIVKENYMSSQADLVQYKNSILVGNTTLDVSFSVKIANQIDEDLAKAKKNLEDLENITALFRSLKGSILYQAVAKVKDVVPPIMKTNIILHNPDFKVAYNTWLFMERNTNIGYDVITKERKHKDSENIALDLDRIGTIAIAQVLAYRGLDGYDFSTPQAYRKNQFNRVEETKETVYTVTPKNIKLAHQEMSEYFLTKAAEYFGDTLDEQLERGLSYELGVKSVYKEMLKMINGIYPSLYNREPLPTEDKTKDELKIAALKQELRVLKQVIDVKKADLKKMEREYERANTKLIKLNKKMKMNKLAKQKKRIHAIIKVKQDDKEN